MLKQNYFNNKLWTLAKTKCNYSQHRFQSLVKTTSTNQCKDQTLVVCKQANLKALKIVKQLRLHAFTSTHQKNHSLKCLTFTSLVIQPTSLKEYLIGLELILILMVRITKLLYSLMINNLKKIKHCQILVCKLIQHLQLNLLASCKKFNKASCYLKTKLHPKKCYRPNLSLDIRHSHLMSSCRT